ncbi:MAG: BCCT family transporter [Desulfobacterales bacterium]|nr:BCCT family transporter [Desulfobacterales bacterium]
MESTATASPGTIDTGTKTVNRLGKYDSTLFWTTLALCCAVVGWGILAPENFSASMNAAQKWVTVNFSWFFMLAVSAFIGFAVWLGLSKYGDIPLGEDNEIPEFSYGSWIAMLFSCGIGVGFIFWGVAEPLYHYISPPYLAKGATPDAAPVAMQISLLHWGIHGWVPYTICGLAIGYTTYRLKMPLSIANSLHGLIGDKTNGVWGKVVDFLAASATIAGISTSLGMGLMSIKYGINHVFGADLGQNGLIVVTLVIIVGYTISAVSGIKRGIKWLSNINMIMAFFVLLFFLFAGPTRFLLNMLVDSVGQYFSNFFFMSFWTDPVAKASEGKWLGWWTVFYWCWWIAWAPFVGGFVARISRGRTIREFIFGVLLIPLVITFLWFNIVGGGALFAEMHQTVELYKAISDDLGSGIFVLLTTYPLGSLVAAVVFFNLIIFLITSCDSAAFFVGMIVSGGELEPSTPIKLIFGFLIGSITLVLFFTGGWKALQIASIVAALPFAFVMVGMIGSIYLMVKRDKKYAK